MAVVPSTSRGSTGAAAGQVALYNLSITGSAGSFDQASIDQSYRHLLVVACVRDNSAVSADGLGVRFNNDSGNNYAWQQERVEGTTFTAVSEGNTTNKMLLGNTTGGTTTANYFSMHQLWIPNYSSSAMVKFIHSNNMFALDLLTTDHGLYQNSGIWNNTAAITRIQVFGFTNANWAIGSTLDIYGLT